MAIPGEEKGADVSRESRPDLPDRAGGGGYNTSSLTLSLILITYNRCDDINRTLSTLKSQDTDFELVVVDNGSTAEGKIDLEGWRNVRFERLETNRGPTGGRNAGIRLTTGNLLVFLDDDAFFSSPRALSRIRDRFRQDPTLGVLTADSRLFPSGDIDYAAIPRKDKAILQGDYETSYFCAVAFAIRREILEETGCFFEPFFYGCEELDLSWRVLERGYRIIRAADLIVHHRMSPEARPSERWIYSNARNRVWLSLINLPWPYVVSYAFIWWGYLFPKSIQRGYFRPYVDGIRDCLKGVPAILKNRRVLNKATRDTIRRMNGRLFY